MSSKADLAAVRRQLAEDSAARASRRAEKVRGSAETREAPAAGRRRKAPGGAPRKAKGTGDAGSAAKTVQKARRQGIVSSYRMAKRRAEEVMDACDSAMDLEEEAAPKRAREGDEALGGGAGPAGGGRRKKARGRGEMGADAGGAAHFLEMHEEAKEAIERVEKKQQRSGKAAALASGLMKKRKALQESLAKAKRGGRR